MSSCNDVVPVSYTHLEEPVSGSFAHFAYKYWGPFAGFLSGWNYWVMFVLVGKMCIRDRPVTVPWHHHRRAGKEIHLASLRVFIGYGVTRKLADIRRAWGVIHLSLIHI